MCLGGRLKVLALVISYFFPFLILHEKERVRFSIKMYPQYSKVDIVLTPRSLTDLGDAFPRWLWKAPVQSSLSYQMGGLDHSGLRQHEAELSGTSVLGEVREPGKEETRVKGTAP